MSSIDLIVFLGYLMGTLYLSVIFSLRKRTSKSFTLGSGRTPQWVVTLSIFATFVSSISYLAFAGQCLWDELERLRIQSFHSHRSADYGPVFCSRLPQYQQFVCLYLYGTTFWSLGQDLCFSMLHCHPIDAGRYHNLFVGTGHQHDTGLGHGNGHRFYRSICYDLLDHRGYRGCFVDRCHPGDRFDIGSRLLCRHFSFGHASGGWPAF